jgi:hypothetical protein
MNGNGEGKGRDARAAGFSSPDAPDASAEQERQPPAHLSGLQIRARAGKEGKGAEGAKNQKTEGLNLFPPGALAKHTASALNGLRRRDRASRTRGKESVFFRPAGGSPPGSRLRARRA